MITPLSIRVPLINSQAYQHQKTPQDNLNKRADSLVFSATSDKYNSHWDTNLLDSKSQAVSKELQTLQAKLQNFQNKVYNITQNSLVINDYPLLKTQRVILKSWYQKSKDSFNKENEPNFINKTQIGKIISKKSSQKTSKPRYFKLKSKQTSFRGSRDTILSNSFQKSKQLSKAKKDLMIIKRSLKKSQRSMSICSDKLQNSKSLIKNLKKSNKSMKKALETMKLQLKKSENIRLKQKQQLLKQKKQIQHYRSLLKLSQR